MSDTERLESQDESASDQKGDTLEPADAAADPATAPAVQPRDQSGGMST